MTPFRKKRPFFRTTEGRWSDVIHTVVTPEEKMRVPTRINRRASIWDEEGGKSQRGPIIHVNYPKNPAIRRLKGKDLGGRWRNEGETPPKKATSPEQNR